MPAENFNALVFIYIAVNPLQSPSATTLPLPTLPAKHCEFAVPEGKLDKNAHIDHVISLSFDHF